VQSRAVEWRVPSNQQQTYRDIRLAFASPAVSFVGILMAHYTAATCPNCGRSVSLERIDRYDRDIHDDEGPEGWGQKPAFYTAYIFICQCGEAGILRPDESNRKPPSAPEHPT